MGRDNRMRHFEVRALRLDRDCNLRLTAGSCGYPGQRLPGEALDRLVWLHTS